MNPIYLRRRSKVLLPEPSGLTPISTLAAFQKNLESLGCLVSSDVIDHLKVMDPIRVNAFYQWLIKELRSKLGANRKFEPMYPNFPSQVMNMTEAELYFNAIYHYWTLGRIKFPKATRPELEEEPTYRLIDLGNREDFESIFTTLLRSKTAFSPQDKEDVTWFVSQYRDDISRLIPDVIPSKENLGYFGAEVIRKTTNPEVLLDGHVKTATDVLRIAVALSGGDVSLATACKFGAFRRRERAMLLNWMERATNRTEDMLRWKPRWVRLGERLHPGEYASRFPQTVAAFDILRNNRPFETFNGQIETGLVQKNTSAVMDLLGTRPGEFARRLDHLLRISPEPVSVLNRFSDCVDGVSTPVLLQVLTHFRTRTEPADLRMFFPKGDVGNLYATTKPLPVVSREWTDQLTAVCERTLIGRFAKLPPLGTCYLDARLRNYLVPFAQRSASKSLRTLVRGSRPPLPDCTTLRFFVWWKNGKSRVDIDLSAAMYDATFKYVDTLAYYNLKNFGAHHSGDIVDAPQGAAEFIDVDLERCLDQKVRYIVMCLSSFTQQPYCELPECFAGWMARKEPNSGEIFEPKTVVDKVDIAADTKFCLPAVFDLVNREVVWADIALSTWPHFPNNVHNHLGGVSLMLRAVTNLRKMNLHSLFDLHIRARGKSVLNADSAETVFAVDRGITPFDLTRIAADFM